MQSLLAYARWNRSHRLTHIQKNVCAYTLHLGAYVTVRMKRNRVLYLWQACQVKENWFKADLSHHIPRKCIKVRIRHKILHAQNAFLEFLNHLHGSFLVIINIRGEQDLVWFQDKFCQEQWRQHNLRFLLDNRWRCSLPVTRCRGSSWLKRVMMMLTLYEACDIINMPNIMEWNSWGS